MENHGALKAGLAVRQRSYISPAVSSAFERALPFGVRGFGSRPFPLLSECCSQREWEATIRGQIGARLGVRGKHGVSSPSRRSRAPPLPFDPHCTWAQPQARAEPMRRAGAADAYRPTQGGQAPLPHLGGLHERGGDTSEPLRGLPKTEKGGRAF